MPFILFPHLRRAVKFLISIRLSHLLIHLGPLVRYYDPWEKKKRQKQTNKHAFVVFLLAKKKCKIPQVYRSELKTSTSGFFDMLNLMVWFSLILLHFSGSIPLPSFENYANSFPVLFVAHRTSTKPLQSSRLTEVAIILSYSGISEASAIFQSRSSVLHSVFSGRHPPRLPSGFQLCSMLGRLFVHPQHASKIRPAFFFRLMSVTSGCPIL